MRERREEGGGREGVKGKKEGRERGKSQREEGGKGRRGNALASSIFP